MWLNNDREAAGSQGLAVGKSRKLYCTALSENDSTNTAKQFGSRLRQPWRFVPDGVIDYSVSQHEGVECRQYEQAEGNSGCAGDAAPSRPIS
jgi:hypothetical protein